VKSVSIDWSRCFCLQTLLFLFSTDDQFQLHVWHVWDFCPHSATAPVRLLSTQCYSTCEASVHPVLRHLWGFCPPSAAAPVRLLSTRDMAPVRLLSTQCCGTCKASEHPVLRHLWGFWAPSAAAPVRLLSTQCCGTCEASVHPVLRHLWGFWAPSAAAQLLCTQCMLIPGWESLPSGWYVTNFFSRSQVALAWSWYGMYVWVGVDGVGI